MKSSSVFGTNLIVGILSGLQIITMSGVPALAAAQDSSNTQTFENDLGPLPAPIEAPMNPNVVAAFSSDGRHVAILVGQNGGECVNFDGQLGPRFDRIVRDAFLRTPFAVFSPNGKHVAYVAQNGGPNFLSNKEVQSYVVVVDGKVGLKYAQVSNPIFSSDGKHVVYIAQDKDRCFAVKDSHAGPEVHGWFQGGLAFSPDGSRTAFCVSQGMGAKPLVVVDGQRRPENYQIDLRSLTFSPDGKHLAYLVTKINRKSYVVVDGQPGPEYEMIRTASPIFSPNGKHWAYVAANGTKNYVVVDGRQSPEYFGTSKYMDGEYLLFYSPDGDHVAYVASNGQKKFVVVDGKPGPEVYRVTSLVFSSDGKHVAYIVSDGSSKQYVVVDGDAGPKYNEVKSLSISSDGKRVAYIANSGFVLVDGQQEPTHDSISSLIMSANGARVAYVAKDADKCVVVLDGQLGSELNSQITSLYFSPDSKHLAYLEYFRLDGKSLPSLDGVPVQSRLVIDGVPGPHYDRIGTPAFDLDGSLNFVAFKNDRIYQVKLKPTAGQTAGNPVRVAPPSSQPDVPIVADEKQRLNSRANRTAQTEPISEKQEKWLSLLNDNRKTGWETTSDRGADWRMEKGVLRWNSPRASYLWTKRDNYSNFDMSVEARVSRGEYGQLIIRDAFGQPGESHHKGYAVVFNSDNGNPCKTGSLLVLGGEAAASIGTSPAPPDEWFTLEVTAKGNHLVVKINDQITADYSDPEQRFDRGHISILGGTPRGATNMYLELRNFKIRELPG